MAHPPSLATSPWLGTWLTGDLGPNTLYTTRRHRLVAFPFAPPTTPTTARQAPQLALFHTAAIAWRSTTPALREELEQITKTLSLSLTGYNLFIKILAYG
jgi:hypothetical protein